MVQNRILQNAVHKATNKTAVYCKRYATHWKDMLRVYVQNVRRYSSFEFYL